MNYNLLIDFYSQATIVQRVKVLHTLMSIFLVELQTIKIDLEKGIIHFEPMIVTSKLLSDIYSLDLLEKCLIHSDEHIENEYKSILYDLIDFFDQMRP